MRQQCSPEDLLAGRTLVDGDWRLVANRTEATRLGFCPMLNFLGTEARFPLDLTLGATGPDRLVPGADHSS